MKSYILCLLLEGIWLISTMRSRYSYGPVTPVPFGLVLKLGKLDTPEEAKTIRFIQRNTQIPVPRIIMSATGIWHHYMLMKEVDGELLHFAWNHFTPQQQARVVD